MPHLLYLIYLLELSNMPIADLLQLKERLGAKMYVAVFASCY